TTYTITVSNAGPSTVSSVTLNDAVPAALLNPSFGAPSAGSYDPATRVWSGLSLAAGQSVTITLTGTIDPAATRALTNRAPPAPPPAGGVTPPHPRKQPHRRPRPPAPPGRPGRHQDRRPALGGARPTRHLHHHRHQRRPEHGQQRHPDRHPAGGLAQPVLRA